MIESLFGYTVDHHKNDQRKDSSQYIKVIDPRKAQNLSILLRALNVTTTEVVDALQECLSFSLSLYNISIYLNCLMILNVSWDRFIARMKSSG